MCNVPRVNEVLNMPPGCWQERGKRMAWQRVSLEQMEGAKREGRRGENGAQSSNSGNSERHPYLATQKSPEEQRAREEYLPHVSTTSI